MKVKIIKAPAGLGKTSKVLQVLRTARHGKIEIYVPTHALAEEISTALGSGDDAISNVVIRGRARDDGNGEVMCKKHLQAAELSRKGWPVTPLLCVRSQKGIGTAQCEHYGSCPYIAQFSNAARVRVYTHASLPLNRGDLEGDAPDLAIIDESFWATCAKTEEIPLGDLFNSPTCVHMDDTDKTPQALALIGAGIQSGEPLLDFLRKSGGEALIEEALAEFHVSMPGMGIHPNQDISDQVKAANSLPPRKEAWCLLQALQSELKISRTASHAVMWVPDKQHIKVCYRQPITRFGNEADVLILDANADPEIIRQWFPAADFTEIPADRNVFVIQCGDSRFSTTSLVPHQKSTPDYIAGTKKRLGELEVLIAREAGDNRRILVVGPQAVMGNPAQKIDPLINPSTNVEFAHFGGIRGLDIYKDFDTVIIVGRNEPALIAAEAQARAIYFDSAHPLQFADEWISEERGYRFRNPELLKGIEVPVHPDLRVQGVVEQIREAETTQAIDRLRHVHSTATKRVFILSNIPVAIDVDLLLSWYDIVYGSRLVQALDELNGVLPLAPEWLAERFPDLWSSPEAARAHVRAAGQTGGVINNISISTSTSLLYDYWANGQKRPSRAFGSGLVNSTLTELMRVLDSPILLREGKDQLQNRILNGILSKCRMRPLTAFGTASAHPKPGPAPVSPSLVGAPQ